MARSRKRSSRRQTKPVFRSGVEAELVDDLLYRFAALVKRGLELILQAPSPLARKELARKPALTYGPADIPALVAWAAHGAYDMSWPDFGTCWPIPAGRSCWRHTPRRIWNTWPQALSTHRYG